MIVQFSIDHVKKIKKKELIRIQYKVIDNQIE